MNNKNGDSADKIDAVSIWKAGVAAVDAYKLVYDSIHFDKNYLTVAGHPYDLQRIKRITVIGIGKCSGAMAVGVEAALENLRQLELCGIVNVPEGQTYRSQQIEITACRCRASNFPTDAVVRQTRRIMKMIEGAGEDTLVIALISGGGSALLEDPRVPLQDLVSVSKLISGSGAPIESLNTVRRAISCVKAGGLAEHLLAKSKASLVGLVLSDVMSDQLEMVASGPTILSTDSVTQQRAAARKVLSELKLSSVPPSINDLLLETYESHATFAQSQRVRNCLLANNATAVAASTDHARKLGYQVVQTEGLEINQDVGAVAQQWIKLATESLETAELNPQAIIAGGEPTVKLCQSPGRGGRNVQLAALVLQGLCDINLTEDVPIWFASGGTDGEDGTVPVAGAIFNLNAVRAVVDDPSLKNELQNAIVDNNCFAFFEMLFQRNSQYLCGLLEPPPVSTNVCDIQVLLRGERAPE